MQQKFDKILDEKLSSQPAAAGGGVDPKVIKKAGLENYSPDEIEEAIDRLRGSDIQAQIDNVRYLRQDAAGELDDYWQTFIDERQIELDRLRSREPSAEEIKEFIDGRRWSDRQAYLADRPSADEIESVGTLKFGDPAELERLKEGYRRAAGMKQEGDIAKGKVRGHRTPSQGEPPSQAEGGTRTTGKGTRRERPKLSDIWPKAVDE